MEVFTRTIEKKRLIIVSLNPFYCLKNSKLHSRQCQRQGFSARFHHSSLGISGVKKIFVSRPIEYLMIEQRTSNDFRDKNLRLDCKLL